MILVFKITPKNHVEILEATDKMLKIVVGFASLRIEINVNNDLKDIVTRQFSQLCVD